MAVRLPRLLDGSLQEVRRLRPSEMSLRLQTYATSYATMTVSGEDGFNIHDWVEVFTPTGSAGLFRISNDAQLVRGEHTLTLMHGIDTLHDSVWKEQTDYEGTVPEFLSALLAQQTAARWQLGTCADNSEYKRAGINYDHLDDLLRELRETRPDYYFTYDFTTSPWTLNFVALPAQVGAEYRLSRNLLAGQIIRNDADMCNRLHLAITKEVEVTEEEGEGEGEEGGETPAAETAGTTATRSGGEESGSESETTTQEESSEETTEEETITQTVVEIRVYNNAQSQAEYGVIEKNADIDEKDVPDPDAWAADFLRLRAAPAYRIPIDVLVLYQTTGDSWDAGNLGMLCRVALPDSDTWVEERMISLFYPDLLGASEQATAELANHLPTFSENLASLSTKVEKAVTTNKEQRISTSENLSYWEKKVRKINKALDDTGVYEMWESGIEMDPVTGVRIYSLYQGLTSELGEIRVAHDQISALVQKTGVSGLSGQETLFSKITETAEQITSVVQRTTTNEGKITDLERTAVIQNSDSIAAFAGKWDMDENGNVFLRDGASLAVYRDGVRQTVGTVNEINVMDREIQEITGSALWTSRNNITGVVGRMYADPHTGAIHIVDGSGLYMDSGQASYGVYTSGNLTGGIIAQKLGDGTVQTTINGDIINLSANTSYSSLVGTVNGHSTSIQQNADAIALKVSQGNVATQLAIEAGNVTISGGNLVVDGYVTANQLQSEIADLESAWADAIVTEEVSANTILADVGVYTPLLSVSGTSYTGHTISITNVSSGTYLGTQDLTLDHYHAITASESNGVITLTLGAAQTTAGTDSFNIADTQYYKDAVASARQAGVQSVTINQSDIMIDPDDYAQYDSANIRYRVPVYAEISNGNGATKDIYISAQAAYNAGAASVTPAIVNVSKGAWSGGDITFSPSSGSGSSASVSLSTTVSWGQTASTINRATVMIYDGSSYTGEYAYVDASARYTAGQNSVTIAAADIEANGNLSWAGSGGSYPSAPSSFNVTVPVKATASNGEYNTNSLTFNAAGFWENGRVYGTNQALCSSLAVQSGGTIAWANSSRVATVPVTCTANATAYNVNKTLTVDLSSVLISLSYTKHGMTTMYNYDQEGNLHVAGYGYWVNFGNTAIGNYLYAPA